MARCTFRSPSASDLDDAPRSIARRFAPSSSVGATLDDFPYLEREDIAEALQYAA